MVHFSFSRHNSNSTDPKLLYGTSLWTITNTSDDLWPDASNEWIKKNPTVHTLLLKWAFGKYVTHKENFRFRLSSAVCQSWIIIINNSGFMFSSFSYIQNSHIHRSQHCLIHTWENEKSVWSHYPSSALLLSTSLLLLPHLKLSNNLKFMLL